jgi:mannosylglycoprotein endo-beta-mannosidase
MMYRRSLPTLLLLLAILAGQAQSSYELNSAWKCQAIGKVHATPEKLSQPGFALGDWLPATVPGTVLTTLINDHLAPDPFYGLNNKQIPDVYTTGRDQYTYWFVRDFRQTAGKGEQVWLHLRGVNYSCEVWLNGHHLNEKTHYGMFLRQSYNITAALAAKGENRLAILVYPPDPVGNPNGGQGGDGEIARGVAHQYVAGWDWIQPIPDRNTGIWDKVTIQTTGAVRILNPHVVTDVPGVRYPDDARQAPAIVHVSAELQNTAADSVTAFLQFTREDGSISVFANQQFTVEDRSIFVPVKLAPHSVTEVRLPNDTLTNPRLWWPNGYGPQQLYHSSLNVAIVHPEKPDTSQPFGPHSDSIAPNSDVATLDFGVRAITTTWNATTRSRQAFVNGQPIFIKGGNWIVSDELLRLSPERYDAEIRFHRDMNLNLIRVWGGALSERPEFYEACDRYGLLVFQDFWNSGDCNGRWQDPMKKADQWTRRNYPDDHRLFLASAADQIKMIRNHPSLAFWCGGNEITPPIDIFTALKDSILPTLDGTRTFIDYSNSDSMSFNTLGGNGDGPYGIQPLRTFWATKTYPFNSEVGSVGMGDYESLERFIPKNDLVPPVYDGKKRHGEGTENEVWSYHKYIGYDSSVYAYGPIKDLRDYAEKAQLVNYDQYRALMEGFSSHMWDWYTGVIIWKTQNPWTALRGQMYDYYLDPNACLYGLHAGRCGSSTWPGKTACSASSSSRSAPPSPRITSPSVTASTACVPKKASSSLSGSSTPTNRSLAITSTGCPIPPATTPASSIWPAPPSRSKPPVRPPLKLPHPPGPSRPPPRTSPSCSATRPTAPWPFLTASRSSTRSQNNACCPYSIVITTCRSSRAKQKRSPSTIHPAPARQLQWYPSAAGTSKNNTTR